MTIRLLHMFFKKSPSSATLYHHNFQIFAPFRLHSSYKPKPNSTQNLPKALRILELISPTESSTSKSHQKAQKHLNLIRGFLQADSDRNAAQTVYNGVASPSLEISKDFSDDFDQEVESRHNDFQSRGASAISNSVSSCSSQRDLRGGIQLHCLALRTGFVVNVYVGSSLVSLYGKCGELNNAYQVFDEMPVRNIVSWTSIIAAFAQEWQIMACLELFQQMKFRKLKPNEFTFATILSACTGSGALGVGRSFHCQTIHMGFDSHLHIANALISMYCKCGAVNSALHIFKAMRVKDIVSWNSMIAGYAQHGLSPQAIDLFESMKQRQVKPDGITFLGVLSACRHGGLVEEGRHYFNLMLGLSLKPELDHYSCVIDLLGRAGLLKEAREFIEKMPICPNSIIWGSLLSACRLHGNVWIGLQAAESRLLLQPDCASTHLQLANLYARAGYLDHAARLRKMMKEKGLKISPGCSWIENQNRVYRFKAEDESNPRMVEIVDLMDGMVKHMRSVGSATGEDDDILHSILRPFGTYNSD